MTLSNVILIAGVLMTTSALVQSQTNSYMLTMLKTIRPGVHTKIWVRILKAKQANIEINLRDSSGKAIARAKGTVKGKKPKALVLRIPQILNRSPYRIEAIGTGSVSFHQNQTVTVSTKSSSVLIQTDKRIYKPGQKVMFRCLGIYPDLKLVTGTPFDVFIYDSKDNLIKQWIDVTPGPSCVFEGQLQLTEYTNLGEWKIKCSQLSASAEKPFDVDEVVFPRFEVKMSVPQVPLVTDDDLEIPVSVKYTFGKPVNGILVMKYTNNQNPVNIITKTFEINGDIITTVLMSQIERTLGMSLVVTATVTEKLTGLKHSSTEEVQLYRYPETLEFPASLPKVFKPNLRYYGILRLVQPDQSPVPGAEGQTLNISVSYEVLDNVVKDGGEVMESERRPIFPFFPRKIRKELDVIKKTIPPNGIIDFNFLLPVLAVSANIQACYKNACAYQRILKAESPSKSFIQIRLLDDTSKLKVGKTIHFTIKSNRNVEFLTFEIVSKRLGTIIYSGRRRLKDNKLPLKLTHSMTPSFTILIYYEEGKEIVADSLTLNVKGLMDRHKVKIKFSKPRVQPAEVVTLLTRSARCGDVHILAVDKRTLLLKTGNDITQNDVVAELLSYGSVSESPGIIPFRWFWFWPIPVNGRDAYTIFNDANIAVITDLTIYKHEELMIPVFQMMENNAADVSAIEMKGNTGSKVGGKVKVRKNFPETWIFQTLKAGQKLRLKAPDAITTYIASAFAVCCESKKGLGVAANTASLTVFKKYFVRVTLPYTAIRGEILVVQVDLFNYENTSAKFYLMIRKSRRNYAFINRRGRRFNPRHPIFKQYWVKEIFVAANAAGTVYFPIQPLKIGSVRLRIDAFMETASKKKKVDAIQRMLLVKAEGVPHSYNIAMLKTLENGETESETVDITFPPKIVKGSQYIQVSVIGDILGPALAGIEDLLRMSYGCGEQNLLNFVPNVFITFYLKFTGRLTPEIQAKAESIIAGGYQRELIYKRSDGSFSAFGDSDSAGSTWLTALVVKSFAEAKNLVYIDPNIFRQAISWLIQKQTTTGTFREPGRVIHKSMQGGTSGSAGSMAAFVVIALIEAKKQGSVPADMAVSVNDAIDLTLDLLSNNVPDSLENIYEMSIVLYALSLAGHSARDVVFTALDALATEEGGQKFWTLPSDQMDEVSGWDGPWHPPKTQARGLDIEMTSYVLSSLVLMNDISNAIKVLKWITTQQNPSGGFVSTQDTMVALQALTAMAKLVFNEASSVVVTASDPNGSFRHTFNIDSSNALVTQIAEVDKNVRTLLIEATGVGICILEVSVRFNIERELRVPSYWINSTITEETLYGYRLTICFRWLKSGPSTMSLLQFEVPTGFDADDSTLDTGRAGTYKFKERKGSAVILYFDAISTDVMCISIYVSRVDMVINPRPRPCSIIDYYEPSNRMTIEYLPKLIGTSSLQDVCGEKCA